MAKNSITTSFPYAAEVALIALALRNSELTLFSSPLLFLSTSLVRVREAEVPWSLQGDGILDVGPFPTDSILSGFREHQHREVEKRTAYEDILWPALDVPNAYFQKCP